jgi:hypothetical protein
VRELRAGEPVHAPQTPGSARVEVCLEAGKPLSRCSKRCRKPSRNPRKASKAVAWSSSENQRPAQRLLKVLNRIESGTCYLVKSWRPHHDGPNANQVGRCQSVRGVMLKALNVN